MKKILGLLMLLVSLQMFSGTTNVNVQEKKEVDLLLTKGDSTNDDTHPRTLVPFTCVYAEGMVQLTLLGEVGEFTLTVSNQLTGEQWSADNALILQTSTASGTYWVHIETEDGSIYYGTYVL